MFSRRQTRHIKIAGHCQPAACCEGHTAETTADIATASIRITSPSSSFMAHVTPTAAPNGGRGGTSTCASAAPPRLPPCRRPPQPSVHHQTEYRPMSRHAKFVAPHRTCCGIFTQLDDDNEVLHCYTLLYHADVHSV